MTNKDKRKACHKTLSEHMAAGEVSQSQGALLSDLVDILTTETVVKSDTVPTPKRNAAKAKDIVAEKVGG